jgi:hypothetical protein
VFFSYDGNDVEKDNNLDDLNFKDVKDYDDNYIEKHTIENIENLHNNNTNDIINNEIQIKMDNKNSENERDLEPDSTEKRRRSSFFFPVNSDSKKEKNKDEKSENKNEKSEKSEKKVIMTSFIFLKINPPQLNEEISR